MAETARFDTGRAVRGAAALLKREPLKLLLWSVLFSGLPDAATTWAGDRFSQVGAAGLLNNWLLLVGTVVVSMLGLVALQAVIALRIAGDHDGSRAYSREAFGLGDCLTLVALGLVTSLGIIGGFILLVIPGIILSLAWMVVTPAMVVERLGVMDSIRRSNALTGNARGQIFGLWVALGLITWLAAWLLGLVTSAVGGPLVAQIAGPALQVVVGLVNSAVAVAIYQELRQNKEGGVTEHLTEVFA